MSEISVEQFKRLSQHIYQKLGLHFDEKKIYFLKKRVEKRMAALRIAEPEDYVFMVGYADPHGLEMQALANLVTTNETYMFREYDQLQAFRQPLPAGSAVVQAGSRREKPCGSGRLVAPPAKNPTPWR